VEEASMRDVVDILTAVGGFALILGVAVGLLQLRGLGRQRQEELVIRLYDGFREPAFAAQYTYVLSWDFTSWDDFEGRSAASDLTVIWQVNQLFAMMGLLHRRGLTSLELLDAILGDNVLLYWNKVAPLASGMRAKYNAPKLFRNVELLARALDERMTMLGEPHPAFIEP
jgi:hypothetical protein